MMFVKLTIELLVRVLFPRKSHPEVIVQEFDELLIQMFLKVWFPV